MNYIIWIFIFEKKYTKIYLSSYLFVKIPDFLPDLPDDFKTLIHQIYNNQNLIDNLPKYKQMFITWKEQNASNLVDELQFMKKQIKYSASETDDDNCKKCFNKQNYIINIAESYFQEKYNWLTQKFW